jgi:hypothetical protein
MSNVKDKMTGVIEAKPGDATCEEIMQEPAFAKTGGPCSPRRYPWSRSG